MVSISLDKFIEKHRRIISDSQLGGICFKELQGIIMGAELDNLEGLLKKYEDCEIKSFCNGIKEIPPPVKNAISYYISSGFVEGNNRKFKLLNRNILYTEEVDWSTL